MSEEAAPEDTSVLEVTQPTPPEAPKGESSEDSPPPAEATLEVETESVPPPPEPPATPEATPEGDLSDRSPPPDDEPGSPKRRRKRPREAPPPLVVPRLDADFWQALVRESRSTRESARRERYANLMRF